MKWFAVALGAGLMWIPPDIQPDGPSIEVVSPARSHGGISLPAGSLVWHSAVSHWTAVVVGAPTTHGGTALDTGTALAFDETDKLRAIHSRLNQGNADWHLFETDGREVTVPLRSTFVPLDRQVDVSQDIIGPTEEWAVRVHAQSQSASNTRLQIPGLGAGSQMLVAGPAGLQVDRLRIPSGTFIESAPLSPDGSRWVAEFLLLDEMTLGTTLLSKGSVVRLAMLGTDDTPTAGLVSKSPSSVPAFEASTLPGSVVFWGRNLDPASYVLAEPLSIGADRLPARTSVFRSDLDTSIVAWPPQSTTVGGVPIDSTSFTRIRNGKVVDAWLASDWSYAPSHSAPRGTRVLLDGGHLYMAVFQQSQTIDGLSLQAGTTTVFSSAGQVVAGTLNAAATIAGIQCGSGLFSTYPSGSVERCQLANAQTVRGIKLRPGTVIITPNGNVIAGVLDQQFTIGIRTLRPGDLLGRVEQDRTTIMVLDATGVNDLENQAATIVDAAIPPALVGLKASVDGLGSFEAGDVHLDSGSRRRDTHALRFPRRYSVRNFLKNPPFANCDCRIDLVPELAWNVDVRRKQIVAMSRLQPGSLINVETNICPTTAFVLLYMAFKNFLMPPTITTPTQEVARRTFDDRVTKNVSTFISLMNGNADIIPSDTVIEDVALTGGVVNVTVTYSRVIK